MGGSARNWLLAGAAALALSAAPAAAQTQAPRLALVIGQADYNGDGRLDTPSEISDSEGYARDLAKPINDAEDIAASLTRLNFNVTTLKNATRAEMLAGVAEFGAKVSDAGRRATVVVYYSGHAMQVDGVNLLIPARARLPGGYDYRRFSAATTQEIIGGETVSLPFILSQLNDPEGDGVNIVILDSCRNNWWDSQINGVSRGGRGGGLSREVRMSRGGADRHYDLGSTLIAYSTQPGNVADDGAPSARNSPYTTALKTHLERPGQTVLQLFNVVARDVQQATADWSIPQRPWTNSVTLPDVCLATCANEREAQLEREYQRAVEENKRLAELLQRGNGGLRPATVPASEIVPLWRPITLEDLRAIAVKPREEIIAPLPAALNELLPKYGLNTPQRAAHFIAQIAHESGGFRFLEEPGDGAAYEGRKNLGNTEPGDGARYKGRGIILLTGRANYRRYGEVIGVDLETYPELAASPRVSVAIALEYWARATRNGKSMNDLADADDIEGITRRINGGLNGIEDRRNKVRLAKAALGVSEKPPTGLAPN